MTNFVGIYKNDCNLAPIGVLSELIFIVFGGAASPRRQKL